MRVCTLLDKKAHRGHDVASMVKYVGFDFPDVFAVGCPEVWCVAEGFQVWSGLQRTLPAAAVHWRARSRGLRVKDAFVTRL